MIFTAFYLISDIDALQWFYCWRMIEEDTILLLLNQSKQMPLQLPSSLFLTAWDA